MSTPTFYHPEPELTNDLVELSRSESSHALKSRRLKLGSEVNLINGKGLLAQGVISEIVRKQLFVTITTTKEIPSANTQLTIVTAVPKGDRQKTMVDMLTQLGIHQLIPLQCDYSSSNFTQKSKEKWQRAAIEACKQSQNTWLPLVHEQLSLQQVLDLYANKIDVQLVYADKEGIKMSYLKSKCDHLMILIGPEGGFSKNELAQLRLAKLTSITFSGTILRTETAAICSASQYFGLNN